MAKQKYITFVLHDESLNTHGFRMLTSGANLEEFRKNPIMLWNHDDLELPIGKWVNIRVDGTKILADADFDLDDPRAAEIARKAEAGYLRACSIGAWPTASSTDPSVTLHGQTYPTITEWTAREASICNIGANHNALASVALYDAYGQRIDMESTTDIETIITLIDKPINKQRMNKELLRLLQLADTATEADTVKAVQQLQKDKQELSDELEKYKARETKALRDEAEQLTDEAIRSGRLAATARESTLKLFALDHESAKATLLALPKRQSVAEEIEQADHKDKADKLLSLSWDELDRAEQLSELRDKYPEIYADKYEERFGVRP